MPRRSAPDILSLLPPERRQAIVEKALGAQLRLPDPSNGRRRTRSPPLAGNMAERYAQEVQALAQALVHRLPPISRPRVRVRRRSGDGSDGDCTTEGNSRSRKATRACPSIIRVAKNTVEVTVIRCDTCGGVFRLA